MPAPGGLPGRPRAGHSGPTARSPAPKLRTVHRAVRIPAGRTPPENASARDRRSTPPAISSPPQEDLPKPQPVAGRWAQWRVRTTRCARESLHDSIGLNVSRNCRRARDCHSRSARSSVRPDWRLSRGFRPQPRAAFRGRSARTGPGAATGQPQANGRR